MRKLVRFSGLGVFFASLFTFVQGCTQSDNLGIILLLLLLLLGGGSGDLTVNGTGSGTVVGADNNINCSISSGSISGTCTDSVGLGTTQTLTATPASGFDFDSWVNCSNPSGNVCNHGMTEAATITANFVQMFTLTVVLSGPGLVTTNIGGISCPGVCSATFPAGTVVALTAAPAGDFSMWTDCGIPVGPSTANPFNRTMNSDLNCLATFLP